MAKKKFVKKVNSSFKIPESFSGLSFKNKIISVVLLALVIGVIASIFPGDNVTGMNLRDIFYQGGVGGDVFYLFDRAVEKVFPEIPLQNLIVYEKFVLFLLLFTLLSGAAKLLNFRGMTNVVVAGAISLISVWFIPADVLVMIGVTYGSVYASLLILIPIFTVGYLAWKIPRTRGGCGAKAIIFFVLLTVFGATKEGVKGKVFGMEGIGNWYDTYVETIMLILIILAIYYLLKALFMSTESEAKAKEDWLAEKASGSIADVILTRVESNIVSGAKKAVKKAVKKS